MGKKSKNKKNTTAITMPQVATTPSVGDEFDVENFKDFAQYILQQQDEQIYIDRVNSLLQVIDKKPNTLKDFGLKYFIGSRFERLKGELNKRKDLRSIEVSLNGEEAIGDPSRLPKHPYSLQPHEELDIVKEGLISVEKLREALGFVYSKDFLTETFTVDLPESIREYQEIKLKNVIQTMTGTDCHVMIKNQKLHLKVFDHEKDKRPDLWLWEKPYVNFVFQRNLRTHLAIEKAAKLMGLKNEKDLLLTHVEWSMGFTHQYGSVRKVEPQLIDRAFWKVQGQVSCITFSDEPKCAPNVFQGYHFICAIREYKSSEEETKKIMDNFTKNGYLNYFYLTPKLLVQRSIIKIGMKLLQNDYSAAIDLIMTPSPLLCGSNEDLKLFYYICKNKRSLEKMIDKLPSKEHRNDVVYNFLNDASSNSADNGAALNILKKCEVDEIIKYIDLFIQFIWNEVVNEMMENRTPIELKVGDLVFTNKDKEHEVLYANPHCAVYPKSSLSSQSLKESVKVLSEEDIKSGRHDVFDLLIPVPGFDVVWPQNDIGKYFDTVLKKYDCPPKENLVEVMSNFSLSIEIRGNYRKPILPPKDLRWKIRDHYAKASISFQEGKTPIGTNTVYIKPPDPVDYSKSYQKDLETNDPEPPDTAPKKICTQPKVKGLVIEFFVPKSTNLIVPLCELFKTHDLGEVSMPFYEQIFPKREKLIRRELIILKNDLMAKLQQKSCLPPLVSNNINFPPNEIVPKSVLNNRFVNLERQVHKLTQEVNELKRVVEQQRNCNCNNQMPQMQQMVQPTVYFQGPSNFPSFIQSPPPPPQQGFYNPFDGSFNMPQSSQNSSPHKQQSSKKQKFNQSSDHEEDEFSSKRFCTNEQF